MNTPCSRNSDDQTSKDADRYISETGIRSKQLRLCEGIVNNKPHYTCRELSAISGVDNEIIHKRLPESLKVIKGMTRKCMVTGRSATTWVMG